MTIDEARELCKLQLDGLMSNPQVTLDPKYIQAERMAIASLEAWQEVRQKIGKLSLSWEYGQGVEDCLAIVDHYMQEVTG